MSLFQKSGIEHFLQRYEIQINDAVRRTRKFKGPDLELVKWAAVRPSETLMATSFSARLQWGKAICQGLEDRFCKRGDCSSHEPQVYLVTIADIDCATPNTERLTSQKLKKFRKKLRRPLTGLSYFGMIEPGFYVHLAEGSNYPGGKNCISWHLHALVWGCSMRKLQRRLGPHKLGAFRPIADGIKAIDSRKIRQNTLPYVTAYILKCPSRGSRLRMSDKDGDGNLRHDEHGEVLKRFRSSNGPLGHGQTLTVFLAMLDLRLDRLAIAGGEGRSIRSAALCNAQKQK